MKLAFVLAVFGLAAATPYYKADQLTNPQGRDCSITCTLVAEPDPDDSSLSRTVVHVNHGTSPNSILLPLFVATRFPTCPPCAFPVSLLDRCIRTIRVAHSYPIRIPFVSTRVPSLECSCIHSHALCFFQQIAPVDTPIIFATSTAVVRTVLLDANATATAVMMVSTSTAPAQLFPTTSRTL